MRFAPEPTASDSATTRSAPCATNERLTSHDAVRTVRRIAARIPLIAFALLGLALTCGAVVGRASDAGTVTIRLVAVPVSSRTVDVEPKNQINPGDKIYGESILRNAVLQFGKPRGAVVGRDSEVGTLVSSQALVLTGVARLPGGTLRLKGKQTLNDLAFSIPVVGGTGRFARARGKCQVQVRGATITNTYRLVLP
jgi:dirigent-like protein